MQTPTPLEIKRHYSELSEKETDEVVDAMADLIVAFLKGKRKSAQPAPAASPVAQAGAQEVQA